MAFFDVVLELREEVLRHLTESHVIASEAAPHKASEVLSGLMIDLSRTPRQIDADASIHFLQQLVVAFEEGRPTVGIALQSFLDVGGRESHATIGQRPVSPADGQHQIV